MLPVAPEWTGAAVSYWCNMAWLVFHSQVILLSFCNLAHRYFASNNLSQNILSTVFLFLLSQNILLQVKIILQVLLAYSLTNKTVAMLKISPSPLYS